MEACRTNQQKNITHLWRLHVLVFIRYRQIIQWLSVFGLILNLLFINSLIIQFLFVVIGGAESLPGQRPNNEAIFLVVLVVHVVVVDDVGLDLQSALLADRPPDTVVVLIADAELLWRLILPVLDVVDLLIAAELIESELTTGGRTGLGTDRKDRAHVVIGEVVVMDLGDLPEGSQIRRGQRLVDEGRRGEQHLGRNELRLGADDVPGGLDGLLRGTHRLAQTTAQPDGL